MLNILLISLGVFIVLALLYEIKQNPSKFKSKAKDSKQKEIKQAVDPDQVIDEKRIKFKNSKEKASTFNKSELPPQPLADKSEIKNNDPLDFEDDSEDDRYDELFNDFSSRDLRKNNSHVEDDEDYDYMYDKDEDEYYNLFSGIDAIDADDLERGRSNYDNLSSTLFKMPSVIKALMLSNILDRKDY